MPAGRPAQGIVGRADAQVAGVVADVVGGVGDRERGRVDDVGPAFGRRVEGIGHLDAIPEAADRKRIADGTAGQHSGVARHEDHLVVAVHDAIFIGNIGARRVALIDLERDLLPCRAGPAVDKDVIYRATGEDTGHDNWLDRAIQREVGWRRLVGQIACQRGAWQQQCAD